MKLMGYEKRKNESRDEFRGGSSPWFWMLVVVNCSSCSHSKTNNSFSFHLMLSLWRELFLRSVGAFAVLHAISIYGPEFCFASQTRAPYLCWMRNIININICFELISRSSVSINWHNFVGDSGGKCWHILIWHFTSSYCINRLQQVQAAFKKCSCFSCQTGRAHQNPFCSCL